MKKYIILFALFLVFCSCALMMTPTPYNWSFSLEEPKPSGTLTYSDDFIDVVFSFGNTQIGFDIQNKTDSGIKINWDDLSVIYPSGTSSRVIHSGIKLADRNNPQAPTVIPPNAKVSDILIPSENIYYSELYNEWKYRPLFGGEDRLVWNDKDFSIYFPLEIKGDNKEYSFKFKINVSLPPGEIK